MLTQRKHIKIMILIIIICFFSTPFIQQSVKNIDQKSFEIGNETLERLENSADTSSPLLWYSQTGDLVQAIAISSDGNYIISGSKSSSKNNIMFYHKSSSVPLWVKDDLNGEVFSVDISSDGSYMVAGTGFGFGADTSVYLFDKNSPTPLWSYQLGDIVFSVAISSNGNYIVAGSKDDRLYLFHRSSSTPIWSYLAGDHISSVSISSDGMYIAAGSGDHKVYCFDRTSSTPLWSHTIDYISGNMGDVESVSISADGDYIVAGTQIYQGTSQVYLFQRSSSTPLWKFSAGDYIESVSIDSTGNYMVAGGQDNKLNLFQRSSSTPLWSYTAGDTLNSVSISADGNYIVSGGYGNDKTIYLFNRTNNIPLWKYKTTDSITSVSISANGSFLVGGGWDENVYLFKSNGSQNHLTIYSDADNPETASYFNLYWNTFTNPEYIWIYQHNSYISEINGSVSLIASGNSINNPYRISGLLSGTYYYKIRINTSLYGEVESNCIKVNIFVMYNLLWSRLFGDDNTQGGKGICIDSLNNIYQTGYIMDGPYGRNDGILLKSNISGVQLWNKTFGGVNDDNGMDVCEDSADDIYVVGNLGGIFTAKYNSNGEQIWNTSWSEISGANGRSIAIDSEDYIYIAGYAGSAGTTDLVFIKYDTTGSKIWQRIWGGSNYEGRYGLKLAIDSQDNIYVAAQTNSFGAGDSDAVLIKYDKFGNQLWNKTWGGVSIDGADAIAIDSNDDIYIAGYTDSFSTNGYRILFITKYSDSGTQIWNKTWEGLNGVYCKDMTVDSKDRIILTGYTTEEMTEFTFLLIYDINGNVLWDTTWGDGLAMMNEGLGVEIDSFDDVYVSGYIDYYNGHRDDIFLLKYASNLDQEPIITINSPQSGDVFGLNAPNYDITISGENESVWYTVDGGVTNITIIEPTGTINQAEWDKLANGVVTLRFYANISFGNLSYSEVNIYKDTIAPIITINSPLDYELFGKSSPSFNLSVDEFNLESMWYSLDGGSTNVTFQELTGTINQNEWDKFGNGTVSITFYAKDKADNKGFTQVIVRKEATPPLITINSPNDDDLFSIIAPTFDITIQEPDLHTTWYTLDDGVTNFVFSGLTGSINQTEWEKFGSGYITLKFYANDSYGFENFSQVTVQKDIGAPVITINSPEQGAAFSSIAPSFNITVFDSQLDSIWYTIDDGSTVIQITNTVGTINQIEWDKKGEENVPLRFYANDTLGNTVYSEVIIIKDTIQPVITINTPGSNDIFGSVPPSFDISIGEINLNLVWYALDGGITNISIISLSGTIDQTEWNKFGNETVTIQFYASDLAGNIGFSQIMVLKDIIAPLISIHVPNPADIFGHNAPFFNLSIVDPNLNSVWYTLNDGITNFSISSLVGTISQTEWDHFGNGTITLKFYANDLVGNEGMSQIIIHKDIDAPYITINSPQQDEIFSPLAPVFDLTVIDLQLDSMWYTIDNGITNISIISTNGVIEQNEWDKLDEGSISIRFYANDSLGNKAFSEVIITKDVFHGIDIVELHTPSTYSHITSNFVNFSWFSIDAVFGAVNFTLQISNTSDFNYIIHQSGDIAETPVFTNYSVQLSVMQGEFFWRVRPTFGRFNGTWSNYFFFTLHINNYAPNLVLNDFSPSVGTKFTIFSFTVIYTDLDNNAPDYVKIIINGIDFSMEMLNPSDPDFTDGCIYQYLTLLTPSATAYTISFECSDGAFYYATNTYIGPLVEHEEPPDGEQGLDNLNSTNTMVMGISVVSGLGIVIPMIVLTEIKLKKHKVILKQHSKIKNKPSSK